MPNSPQDRCFDSTRGTVGRATAVPLQRKTASAQAPPRPRGSLILHARRTATLFPIATDQGGISSPRSRTPEGRTIRPVPLGEGFGEE